MDILSNIDIQLINNDDTGKAILIGTKEALINFADVLLLKAKLGESLHCTYKSESENPIQIILSEEYGKVKKCHN